VVRSRFFSCVLLKWCLVIMWLGGWADDSMAGWIEIGTGTGLDGMCYVLILLCCG
jgi:hypothetical protein